MSTPELKLIKLSKLKRGDVIWYDFSRHTVTSIRRLGNGKVEVGATNGYCKTMPPGSWLHIVK